MKILKVLYVLIILWGVDRFILKNFDFEIIMSNPAMITAIVCCTIAFVAVVIPFIISKD